MNERAANELTRHEGDEGLRQAVLLGRVEAEFVQDSGSVLVGFRVGVRVAELRDDAHTGRGAAHTAVVPWGPPVKHRRRRPTQPGARQRRKGFA